MRPLAEFPAADRRRVTRVMADIDDTITSDGLVSSAALAAIERLTAAGIDVVPVTGRPAGWCDHIARMWPVAAVIGENGAFYFRYDRERKTLQRRFFLDAAARAANRRRLEDLGRDILARVPGAALASDQAYRDADLAIDYCEDVPRLPQTTVDRIVRTMTAAGAHAKVSSIHVNAWFGDYDKLTMARILFRERFAADLERVRDTVVYVGDSPNDEPMFRFFPFAVGVANVRDFGDRLKTRPAFVTRARAGLGFAEVAEALLAARKGRRVSRSRSRPRPRTRRSGSRARAR
ncbi:MAG: HAD-IIB family hydrolase [Rhodospirillales bacterium]|nr:HAD-IIB family hydrolase [Rhodospirillales bacterium]